VNPAVNINKLQDQSAIQHMANKGIVHTTTVHTAYPYRIYVIWFIHTEPEKSDILFLTITLTNLNRFL